MVVKQLKGLYGEAYNVFSEVYIYEVEYLDEPSRSFKSEPMRLDLDSRKIKLNLQNAAEDEDASKEKAEL